MINFFVFLKPEEYNFTGLSPVGQGMPVTGMCSFLSLINHSPGPGEKSIKAEIRNKEKIVRPIKLGKLNYV